MCSRKIITQLAFPAVYPSTREKFAHMRFSHAKASRPHFVVERSTLRPFHDRAYYHTALDSTKDEYTNNSQRVNKFC